jgi:serine/threonine protein kinase
MGAVQLADVGQAVGESETGQKSYRVLERLASGGMATVYRAVQAMPSGVEREVVIKRIKPQLADDQVYVNMFVEEARLSALLNHPHLVQTFDLQLSPRGYFMTMEYVDGVSLLEVFRQRPARRPLPLRAVGAIMVQLLDGLHYAHNVEVDGKPLGLVHRDVSPANVMISTEGVVKLLDFGIAKPLAADDRQDTQHGMLKGKFAYMSPEQIGDLTLSARSDVFVAGTLLWESLTGRRLFKAKSDYATLQRICRADVTPPSRYRPEISPRLDHICLTALQVDPEDRFESAEQMSDALEQEMLAETPVFPSDLADLVEQTRGRAKRKLEPIRTARLVQPVQLRDAANAELMMPDVVGEFPAIMPA